MCQVLLCHWEQNRKKMLICREDVTGGFGHTQQVGMELKGGESHGEACSAGDGKCQGEEPARMQCSKRHLSVVPLPTGKMASETQGGQKSDVCGHWEGKHTVRRQRCVCHGRGQ